LIKVFVHGFHFSLQADDFSNPGDWPTLGADGTVEIRKSTQSSVEMPTTARPTKSTSPAIAATAAATTSGPEKAKDLSKIKSPIMSRDSSTSAALDNKTQQSLKSAEEADDQTVDEASGSGNATATNGNKKASKQKWVPLEIELPKGRSQKPEKPMIRRRRYDDYDDRYSERPPRRNSGGVPPPRYRDPPSYRGSGSGSSRGRSTRGGRLDSDRSDSYSSSSRSAPRRPAPTYRRSGPIQRSTNPRHSENGYKEFSADYAQLSSASATASGDGTGFIMPFFGTFYYNGAPCIGMDSNGIKELIRKQM
jgi:hypothetical protein